VLENWLTDIDQNEHKLIFVGLQPLFGQFGVRVMILFFREKTCHILNLCRLSSGDEQIGCVLLWALLQRDDIIETIRSASEALELVALDIFAKHGWTNNNIICF